MTGTLCRWFQSYLSNQLHFVCRCSEKLEVLPGVPQDSVRGTFQYLVYINGVPTPISKATLFLITDDTKIIHTIFSLNDCSQLQKDVDSF